MKRLLFLPCLAVSSLLAQAATITVSPWQPVFKGIDYATGQQAATQAGERNVRVNCFRIDLTDPDIRLLPTPACTNSCAPYETLAENTSHFLEHYQVQVAVNCNFYTSSFGPGDVPLGTPEDLQGLAITEGAVVSPQNVNDNTAVLIFNADNQPLMIATNWPATNTAGFHTGISGDRPLLVNGVNIHDPGRIDYDPRTAFGISQDRRYLYMQTLDGRQSGWSDGENWYYTGEWLRRFGAWDAVNVDGGGSTTMAMADCQGKSVRLNRSSFVAQYGRERVIGHNFGVYAATLPTAIENLVVHPGATTAVLTWHTDAPTTTQAEYGLTTSYGSATPLDTRPVREHAVTLNGLVSGSNYFFRAISTIGEASYTQACAFVTTSSVATSVLFPLTNAWRYSTNNLDATPAWKTRTFDESSWSGPSNACLHIESSGGGTFAPRNTVLPPGIGANPIFRTYYLRTHFNYTGSTAGLTLTFSNYIDDGAVFYLNGVEIRRVRMPTTAIVNSTYASGTPCTGTPTQGDSTTACPDVFTISGNLITNVLQGDNVVAVEVHNFSTGADILFGSALFANRPGMTTPQLFITSEDGVSVLSWNGAGFTLQRSPDLSSPANWTDVPGPVTQSSATLTNGPSTFYRLRN